MRIATISILFIAVLSVSCSHSAPPAASAQTEPKKPPQKQQTVIDAELKAIDKAKAVQGTLDQQKKDMDKKLEDSGG